MVDLVALSGLVEDVEPDVLGSSLTADASASDTVLPVASTEPFASETGVGSVIVNGVVYAQTEVDEDASTITISPGLASGADQDDQVNVSPISSNVVAKVRTTDGDLLTARVSIHHIPYLRIGQRDPGQRETVTLYREGQGYVTLDVLNGTANTDANGLPLIPAEAVAGAAYVFIDGPPDFYSPVSGLAVSGDETEPLVDYATMLAATSAEWAALVSSATFADGTLSLSRVAADQMDDSTFPSTPYFPVWLVPTGGADCRVVMDSLTVDHPTPGHQEEDATLLHMMCDGATTMTATVDNFQRVYDTSSPYTDVKRDRFVGYQSAHGGGFFQTPPYVSYTAAESFAATYGEGTVGSHVAVVVGYPFWEWYYSTSTPPQADASWEFAGVRVTFE